MKNYKFTTKLEVNQIIDLSLLKRILLREVRANKLDDLKDNPNEYQQPVRDEYDPDEDSDDEDESDDEFEGEEIPTHPRIYDVKYTREDTKLSIRFSTPIFKKPKKKTRVNIFMRGKINILGAFDADITRQICDYLRWIFVSNIDDIIVDEHCYVEEEIPWEENIENEESPEEIQKIIDDMIHALPELPPMSDIDVADVMSFIDKCYREEVAIINSTLNRYLTGTDLEKWISVF
jgi:hypothetical protein